MNKTLFVPLFAIAAAAAAGCTGTDTDETAGQSVAVAFDDAVVIATPLDGDRIRAEVHDLDDALVATLDWDGARNQGTLTDVAGARSERVSLDDASVELPLELVAEMAYKTWRGDVPLLSYGDCYWAGVRALGVECCWGNRGWDCIIWY